MKSSVKLKLSLLALLALSGLVACVKTPSQNPAGSDDVILIGEVDSMTGPEATFGIDTYRGILLAIEQANANGGVKGRKLRLISNDVQGKPDEGARAIAKLITQDKVVAVLTGATSSNAMAMAPLAQHHQIPLIASAATTPKLTTLGDYIFRVCFIDPFQGNAMAKFAFDTLNFRKVAILRDVRSDYSIGLADVFISIFKEKGGELLVDQSYSGGDMDFRSQLTTIRGKKPDAIFIPGYYTDVSLIARQARELGMTMPLLGGDGWDSPKLKEIGGEALAGSYFLNFYTADDPSLLVKNFLTSFQTKYNVIPDGSAAMGYEAAKFLIQALHRAKSLSPSDIREALSTTKNLETLNGKMSVDAQRNAIKSAVVLKIEKTGGPHYWSTVNP